MEYSNILGEPKNSTSVLLQLYEMKENFDDDSEIEDFGLHSLFEEIDDLPEVLIDEQLNNSSVPELDSLLSSDSFFACVALLQDDDDFLFIDFIENYLDIHLYRILCFAIIFIIFYILFLYSFS